MKNFVTLLAIFAIGTPMALAQSSTTSVPPASPENTISSTVGTVPSIFANPHVIAGVDSWSDFGRQFEESNPNNGMLMQQKNELYLGAVSEAGWGVQGMVVPYVNTYDAGSSAPSSHVNKEYPGDPSISLIHPIYKSDTLKIWGRFREYFPAFDYSVSRNTYQQAYYVFLTWLMPHKFTLWNQLTPRYFSQTWYGPTDTTFFAEDYTTVTRPVNDWLRIGLGQHTQVEDHPIAPVGNRLDLYPMADFVISQNVFLGPRVYFPVFNQNSVYFGSLNVSMNSVQTELYFHAAL